MISEPQTDITELASASGKGDIAESHDNRLIRQLLNNYITTKASNANLILCRVRDFFLLVHQ